MTVHLEAMTLAEITEKFKGVSRSTVRQYRKKYADDPVTLARLEQAYEDVKRLRYEERFGAPLAIRRKANSLWQTMIARCNPDRQVIAYRGVSCSDEFRDFYNFLSWCTSQKGFMETDTNGFAFELDKDILVRNNKVYSRETCVFVPKAINFFFISRQSKDGLPIGVTFNEKTGKYVAQLIQKAIDRHFIAHFDSVEDAEAQYKLFRKEAAILLAHKWKDKIDPRVFDALCNYEP